MYCIMNWQLAVGTEYEGVSYPIVLLTLASAKEMLAQVVRELPNATIHEIVKGEIMYCPECDAYMEEDEVWCPECDTHIDSHDFGGSDYEDDFDAGDEERYDF